MLMFVVRTYAGGPPDIRTYFYCGRTRSGGHWMYALVSSADIHGGGTTRHTPLFIVVDICWGDH